MAYNGWKNRETWAANLWLTNDEASYQEVEEIIRRADSQYDAAQALKDMVEDANPLQGKASLFSDLLTGALSEVDWLEVIKSWTD